MREIKFRCWDKRHKEMFYSDHERRLATFFDMFTGECCTEVIMQYTGLKDKNGKEIYEGDIVSIDYIFREKIKGIVEFMDGNFAVRYLEKIGRLAEPLKVWSSKFDNRCEVIGNIYENPELLEG